MTYREAIYIISDLSKTVVSDDSFIVEEHIKFLLDKYRVAVIKKHLESNKHTMLSQSNYQTICIPLEMSDVTKGSSCGGEYLKSSSPIPTIIANSIPQIYLEDYYQTNVVFVSSEKMRYVGYNKYLKNIIYCSISPDNYLFFKSNNPQHIYLESIKIKGLFEKPEDAEKFSCECECDNDDSKECNPLDKEYPLEEGLFSMVQELVLKDILGTAYKPVDSMNNANDDLSDLIAWARRNMKSDIQKQIEA